MASGAFEKREKAFEAKWAHDEELRFKVFARRNKLLGLWAAGHLGLTGESAQAYARKVVAADFTRPGDSDVIAKLRQDFDAKGVPLSDQAIKRQMDMFLETAKIEAAQEGK